jgi:hypothetical protein
MVGYKIHDQLHVPKMQLTDQFPNVFHGTEFIHNVPVVRNVVSIVHIRAFIAGAKPDCIDPKIFQIVQPGDNSLQVTNTVAIGILKTSGIDLIDMPPEKVLILIVHHILHLADDYTKDIFFVQQILTLAIRKK